MRSRSSSAFLITGIAASSLVLAGCATASIPAGDGDDNGLIQIVASTDVYGDIASRVGGEFAEVTSIISGSTQDPHSYEATAQDQLTLSNADLVIENGGGYDPFIDSMLDASGDENVVVVNASEASGLIEEGAGGHDDHAGESEEEHAEHEGDVHAGESDDVHAGESKEEHAAHIEGFNEHVWYSFHGVEKIAEEIAHELGKIDEANATAYEENYQAFAAEIAELEERAEGMRTQVAGQGVVVTEPVPDYLLEEVGFENLTPPDFSEAVEEGTDVAPAVLQQTLSLLSGGSVALLAYNEQTSGPVTEQVRAAAEDAGILVVSLTETLPEGEDYIGWMSANLDALEEALA